MTKEQWESLRTEREIPMYTWFEYYKEAGGSIDDFEAFEQIFVELLASSPVVVTNSGGKQITLASATRNIHQFYNKKFGV